MFYSEGLASKFQHMYTVKGYEAMKYEMVMLLLIQRYFLVIGDFKDKFYLLFYVYEIFIGCLSGYHMCDWWPWKPERVSGALELESWFM